MADFRKSRGKKHFQNKSKNYFSKELQIPRIYKSVAKVLRGIDEKTGSIKNLVYSNASERRPFHLKILYALVYQSIKYKTIITHLVEEIKLFEQERNLNVYLAWVLIYDLLFGKKSLPGESLPVKTILNYKQKLTEALMRYLKEKNVKSAEELLKSQLTEQVCLPRYARVNTLLITVSNVVRQLIQDGYHQQHYGNEITLDEYYDKVKNLEKNQFLRDIHFEDLLVFAHGEDLSKSLLYEKRHIILQDKASYLAVKVLSPPRKSIVLDSCAAPGIKTLHLASLMENTGKLYAFDISSERFKTLQEMIKLSGIKNCISSCTDFTSIDPQKHPYSSVEYILIDPSCSGSGMVSRLDSLTDDDYSKCPERIIKLSRFQIVLLKHALSFPNVKRVVYSTCSVNIEENEEVIKDVLMQYSEDYKIIEAYPEWPIRGKEEYEFGHYCLRSYPEKVLTNGFFIAVFEKLQKLNDDLPNNTLKIKEEEIISMKKTKKRKIKLMAEEINNNNEDKEIASEKKHSFEINNLIPNADEHNFPSDVSKIKGRERKEEKSMKKTKKRKIKLKTKKINNNKDKEIASEKEHSFEINNLIPNADEHNFPSDVTKIKRREQGKPMKKTKKRKKSMTEEVNIENKEMLSETEYTKCETNNSVQNPDINNFPSYMSKVKKQDEGCKSIKKTTKRKRNFTEEANYNSEDDKTCLKIKRVNFEINNCNNEENPNKENSIKINKKKKIIKKKSQFENIPENEEKVLKKVNFKKKNLSGTVSKKKKKLNKKIAK